MPRKFLNRAATPEEIDFQINLFKGALSVPNEFTKGMGKAIKEAREESGISQNEFAKSIGSNQSTISDIEKGKNEIGVITLAKIALKLHKPIDYFFPVSLLSSIVTDIQNKQEEEALLLFKQIEHEGDPALALKILKTLKEHMLKQLEESLKETKG